MQAAVGLQHVGAHAQPAGAVNGHEAAVLALGYELGHAPAAGLRAVRAEAQQQLRCRVPLVGRAEKAPIRREHEAGEPLLACGVAQNGELFRLAGGRERPEAALAYEGAAAVLALQETADGAYEAQAAVCKLRGGAYEHVLRQLHLLIDIARLGRGGGGDGLCPGPGQPAH